MQDTQAMYRITYISKSAIDANAKDTQAQIASILDTARTNNKAMGITGALLYSGGYFCQVIEGAEDSIEELYETIQMDDRHKDVTVLKYEEVQSRKFNEWEMAYAGFENQTSFDIAGIKDSANDIALKKTGDDILQRLESLVIKQQGLAAP